MMQSKTLRAWRFKENSSFDRPSSALGSPMGLKTKSPGSSVASTLWRNSGKYQHQIFNGNIERTLLHKGRKEPSVRASPADSQVRDRFGHTEQPPRLTPCVTASHELRAASLTRQNWQAMRMPRPESW